MAQGMGEALDEKICTNMICHYGKAGAALSLICDSFDHLLTNSSVSIFRLYIQTRELKKFQPRLIINQIKLAEQITLIILLGFAGKIQEALALFSKMQGEGIKPGKVGSFLLFFGVG